MKIGNRYWVRWELALLLPLLGCVEPPGDDDDSAGFCEDTPVLTWDNFGRSFLVENCQTCHASTSPNRHDAPEEITFDTEEQALALATSILGVATGESPAMPPEGGVAEEDRYKLEVWLRCYGG